jgi:anti-sigma regulatory factor (Ser/Thr protein kinase)
MTQTRTFTFRSRPEAVAAARRALDGFDELLELGVFYDASLCVSELVTNAIIHAEAEPDEELRLDVALDERTLRVTVTDPGNGFDPPTPTAGDESGWGLYIVDRLSRNWGVERAGGTRVWFEMPVADRIRVETTATSEKDPDVAAVDEGETRRSHERASSRLRLRPQTTL